MPSRLREIASRRSSSAGRCNVEIRTLDVASTPIRQITIAAGELMDRRKSAPDRRQSDRYDSDRRGEHHYPADEHQTDRDRRSGSERDELKKRLEQIRG